MIDAPSTATPEWHGWTTESTQRAVANVQDAVNRFRPSRRPALVLDAGCGSVRYVDCDPDAHIVGVDVSEAALARDRSLSERIVGDIETCPLPSAAYDVVLCWYLLEHLPHPERAVERLARAVRPGGLLVLAVPNFWSPKALVTKFTPFALHVAFRRYVLGEKDAGAPGNGPFPTTMRRSMAPDRLIGQAKACGLDVVHTEWFEDEKQVRLREMLGLTGKRWRLIDRAVRGVSGGRLEPTETEVAIVFQRPSGS